MKILFVTALSDWEIFVGFTLEERRKELKAQLEDMAGAGLGAGEGLSGPVGGGSPPVQIYRRVRKWLLSWR